MPKHFVDMVDQWANVADNTNFRGVGPLTAQKKAGMAERCSFLL